MAERRQKRADRAMRPTLRSAGRPPPRRKVERELWRRIAGGLTSEDAAAAVGVSGPVGTRWFRHGGGMSPTSLAEPSGRYLSFAEREEIALLRAQDYGVREIARRIGRDASTSHPSCVAMPLLAPVSAVIGPRWHSGRPSRLPSVPRPPSSPPTTGCGTTSKTDCLGRSGIQTEQSFVVRPCRRGRAGTSRTGRTGSGPRRGVRSRSATGWRSTSQRTSPCESATRPSTRRFTCKAAARFAGS